MSKLSWLIVLWLAFFGCKGQPASSQAVAQAAGTPRVVLETNHGEIEIELLPAKAPLGVKNFLRYLESGAYNGTIFHRVVRGFVIQGGGFEPNLQRRPTLEPLQNEADNGLGNERGTVAWARTPDPHSATNQFYVNLKANPGLDHHEKTQEGWGYAVFGKVVRGLEVADRISELPVGPQGPFPTAPKDPVVIQRARLVGK
jgi:cyclophilin family peptidyl-prolyl cis-trans isomerase